MATTGRIVYHGDDETIKKEKREFSLTDEIMELINSGGGGGGGIQGVKVNGQVVNPDGAGYVGLTIPGVINNLSSNSTSDALSAKQGKVLYEYIQALQHVGHFLALWNTATGLPVTNPETSPYTYNTGDYYIVSNIAAEGGTNYKPNGSSYTINVASTTVESGDVQVNDLYFYDGYERRLLDNSGGGSSIAVDSSLSTTSTNPVQNMVITNRLNQMALDANTKTFFLANGNDLTAAQAAYDWIRQGKMALVTLNGETYIYKTTASNKATFEDVGGYTTIDNNGTTGVYLKTLELSLNGTTVEQISLSTKSQSSIIPSYLATDKNYATAYVPQYDGSPATKKYVDDKFSAVPVYTAGSNIDITSNQISTIRNGYVYVTCTDAATTKAKTGTSAEGNYTPQEGDLIMIHFTQGCSVGGPTIAIDGGTAIPFYIGVEGANAGNMYFGSNNVSKMFIYTDGKLVGDAVKDNNTVYSAGTGLALSNGVFSNTQPGPIVSSTAPSSPSEGAMRYDTDNDVLKVYNGSSWDEAGGEDDIKLFTLNSTSDLTTAQAAYDFGASGGLPIIRYSGETFIPHTATFTGGNAPFWAPTTFSNGASYTVIDAKQLFLYASSGTVIQVGRYGYTSNTLSAGKNYTTPYTPQYDGSPATKKYVDDAVGGITIPSIAVVNNSSVVNATPSGGDLHTLTLSDTANTVTKSYVDGKISSGTTAPSSPTEGMLWYDTTNDVLKVYDGTNWNVVGSNTDTSNTKTFYLSSTSDLTTAQAVVDWYLAGKNPLIMMSEAVDGPDVYEDKLYKLYSHIIEADEFSLGFNELAFSDSNEITEYQIYIEGTISNGVYTVTTITNNTYSSDWIPTFNNAPYTPTNDYNPSTKKYVDDKVKGAISSGTTAPSSPTEGQLRYDTTNDELKVYDGTTWNVTGGGIKLAANSPLTVTEIWAGTETQYNNLSSKGATTAYLCVEE